MTATIIAGIYHFEASQFQWEQRGGPAFGTAEASMLGLAVGEWPDVLLIQGRTEQRMFHKATLPHPKTIAEANERGHHYRCSKSGITVMIIND